MRRYLSFLSITVLSLLLFLCAFALRTGLFDVPFFAARDVKFTVFNGSDVGIDVTNSRFYPNGYERVDCLGDVDEARAVIEYFRARIVKEEKFGDELVVLYAYSHKLVRSVGLECGDVNIMIAINASSGAMTVGYPLIKGSF